MHRPAMLPTRGREAQITRGRACAIHAPWPQPLPSAGMTLQELTEMCIAFRDERDWKQFHTPKDLAINLAIEAGELLELMQWKRDAELVEHLKAHRQDLADELADVLHSVLLLAEDQGIDLGQAFVEKMKKNAAKYPVEKARGRSTKYDKL